jgi:hypothetical protein
MDWLAMKLCCITPLSAVALPWKSRTRQAVSKGLGLSLTVLHGHVTCALTKMSQIPQAL